MQFLSSNITLTEEQEQVGNTFCVGLKSDLTGQKVKLGFSTTAEENKRLADLVQIVFGVLRAVVEGQPLTLEKIEDIGEDLKDKLVDLFNPNPVIPPVAPPPPPSLVAFAQLMQTLIPGAQISFVRGGLPNAPNTL